MACASGSAEVDRNGTDVLLRVATQLKKSPHQIMVIGHTDNRPIGPALLKQYPTNWELAGARASSVVRLFADSGHGRGLVSLRVIRLPVQE
jgi:chemotaxis protein MotB